MLNTIKTEEGILEREEIEQVRRLLFGEVQEANKRRMDALEASLLETRAALERQIVTLGSATNVTQANLIREIGAAISALGHQIAGLATDAAPLHASVEPAVAVETAAHAPEPRIATAQDGFDPRETSNASSADASARDHE